MSWLDYWYPVAFGRDLRSNRPLELALLDRRLVLYRDANGEAVCLEDRCPHRSTPLSLGRVQTGRLECPYHGWQFGAGGRCERIPTLAPDGKIPEAAHAQVYPTAEVQGVVWVWPGDPAGVDVADITVHPELEAVGWAHVDMSYDFELDHGLMVENLLDPSHLPFTHEGTLARRSDAQPLEVSVEPRGEGFVGTARRTRGRSRPAQRFTFEPPGSVRLDLVVRPGWDLIQIHYCTPLGTEQPRMRMLTRMVRNWLVRVPGMSYATRRGSDRILRQDTAMLLGQQERLARGAPPWNCPVGADRMAVAYRRWREGLEAAR